MESLLSLTKNLPYGPLAKMEDPWICVHKANKAKNIIYVRQRILRIVSLSFSAGYSFTMHISSHHYVYGESCKSCPPSALEMMSLRVCVWVCVCDIGRGSSWWVSVSIKIFMIILINNKRKWVQTQSDGKSSYDWTQPLELHGGVLCLGDTDT